LIISGVTSSSSRDYYLHVIKDGKDIAEGGSQIRIIIDELLRLAKVELGRRSSARNAIVNMLESLAGPGEDAIALGQESRVVRLGTEAGPRQAKARSADELLHQDIQGTDATEEASAEERLAHVRALERARRARYRAKHRAEERKRSVAPAEDVLERMRTQARERAARRRAKLRALRDGEDPLSEEQEANRKRARTRMARLRARRQAETPQP